MNTFHSYIAKIKPKIDDNLDNIMKSDKLGLQIYGLFGRDAVQKIIEFSKLGKSLRGSLFILSSEIFGSGKGEYLFDIACGIEIIQSSLLIHDDIIDNDFLRRGNPSVFAQYMPLAEKLKIKNTVVFSKSMGICVGDIGFFFGMKIFHDAVVSAGLKNQVLGELIEEIMIVGIAQMNDVYYGNLMKSPDVSEIEKVYIYKTARYTFSLPLVLGAIISGKDSKLCKILREIGIYTGVLYQIRDDEIGIFSDEKTIGKPLGSDIRENKKTLLRHFLFQKAQKKDVDKLKKIFGKKDLTKEDIMIVRNIAESVKLSDYLVNLKDKYRLKAYSLITELGFDSERSIIEDMIGFAAEREK